MKASFDGDFRAPGEARRFVGRELDGMLRTDSAPRRDDIVLVTSELVTNSVRAGAGKVDVEIVVRADRVSLKVVDDADGTPQQRDAGPEALSGRGLAIVARLADQWSVDARKRGKRVTVTWSRS